MQYRVASDDAPEGMTALELASAGQRFGAWLVDAVISIIVAGIGLALFSVVGPGGEIFTALVVIAYAIVVLWLVATRGQSPGKMAINIKIVKVDGRPLGFGGMLLREIIGKIISSLIIFLGYIWILFDTERQGWHDKIAGTYVVKV